MDTKLIRTFHPVGQGAFYTEEFYNIEEKIFTRIAYDCGGSNKPLMKNYIENQSGFEKDLQFDAGFISHLDRDHINGLEYLLRHCKVKKIFLPLLTPNEKIYLFSKYQSDIEENEEEKENDINFLNNLFFDNSIEETRIYRIGKSETPPETEDENYIDISGEINQNDHNETVLKNKQIKLNKNWVFSPYNLNTEIYILKFITEIKKVFPDLTDEKIKDIIKNKKDLAELKKIYRNIFNDDLNLSNMIVYSGYDYNSRNRKEYYHHCRYVIHNNFRFYCDCHPKYCCCANCMYFGDFKSKNKTNWDQFENYYKKYWDNVGMVQIPHHGSWIDYNEEINKNPKLSVICSNPEHKKYKHPHKETLISILENSGIPFLVTKEIKTLKIFEYHLR